METPDRDAIVDEAVGQTHAMAPPKSVTEKEHFSPEEAARRNAPAPGPEASMPEKSAASIGERVGDAYADVGSAWPQQRENSDPPVTTKSDSWNAVANCARSAGRELAQNVSNLFSDQRLAGLVTAFGLGFITASVLRGRR